MTTQDKLKEIGLDVNTDPTDGQKSGGNYKKSKINIKGLKITIENPAGSIRSGIDGDNQIWSNRLDHHYGYLNGTIGKDGDPLDIFINTEFEEDSDIFVIDQVEEDSRVFDEHKIMFGFKDEEASKKAYHDCYAEGWSGFGNITRFTLDKFKKWIKNADLIKYPASKLSMTTKIDYKNKAEDDSYKVIRMFGEVEEGKTLANLQKQAGDLSKIETLVIEIASPGGSVSEGLEIMVWLDNLSKEGKQIVTIVVANAYSIASLIMLAANMRLISKHGKVMVHNPMLPELQYVNANDLEQHIESLRELESIMYELYEIFTGLDREGIKLLMDNETYLSPSEAVEYGFADTVVDIKPKPFEVAINIKNEINMSKTLNILNKVIGLVNGSQYINQSYSDELGGEIEIFQKDPSTYLVGDRTSVEEGEVKLSDGSKLIIKDFVIDDIDKSIETQEESADAPIVIPEEAPAEEPIVVPVEEPVDDFNQGPAPEKIAADDAPVVEPGKSKDDMPTKVIEKTESTVTTKETVAAEIKELSSWEVEVVNESFEIGDIVEYKPYEGEDSPKAVSAGEYLLDDGRKILTNSEGVIKYIEPAVGTEAVVEVEAVKAEDAEAVVDAEAVKDEDEAEAVKAEAVVDADAVKAEEAKEGVYQAKFEALEKEMLEMKQSTEAKFKEVAKFEEVAATAIDTLAENTVSGFKPDAKAKAGETPRGSIFTQLKAKADLAKTSN